MPTVQVQFDDAYLVEAAERIGSIISTMMRRHDYTPRAITTQRWNPESDAPCVVKARASVRPMMPPRETAARAQRRFAADNAAIADGLADGSFGGLAAVYRESARRHAAQADRLERDGTGEP